MNTVKISQQRLHALCRIGTGAGTCRYILGGPEGYECGKHQRDLAAHIDARVRAGTMVARGDNCEGLRGVPFKTSLQ